MADKDAPFLKRWSKLKRSEPGEAPDINEANPVAEVDEAEQATEAAPPPDLPDIESLDAESDFTGFLQDGVPEQLKRAALQKLWRSSPELAVLDGLNDYDDDYSIVDAVVETVTSAYKAGEGYIDAVEKADRKNGDEQTPGGVAREPDEADEADDEPDEDAAGAQPED